MSFGPELRQDLFELVYSEEIALTGDEREVDIEHNQDANNPLVQFTIGENLRLDLIANAYPKNGSTDVCTVIFSEAVTGRVDIVVPRFVRTGELTPVEKAAFVAADVSVDNPPVTSNSQFGGYNSIKTSDTWTWTETSWVEKINSTAENLSAGNYRVGWYCEVRGTRVNRSIEIEVLVDGERVAQNLLEPKDVDNYIPISGFSVQTFAAGSHTVVVRFRSSSGQMSAGMRNARAELWRVG